MNEEFDTDNEANEKPVLDYEAGGYIQDMVDGSIFTRQQLAEMAGCTVGAINAWCRGENLSSHRFFLNLIFIISAVPKKLRHFDYPKNIVNAQETTEEVAKKIAKKIASFKIIQKGDNLKRKVKEPKKPPLPQVDESKKITIGKMLQIKKFNKGNSTIDKYSTIENSEQSTGD